MRRSILLAAVLAGGLTAATAAEADGRHGHRGGHARMFHHSQQFAQPSSLRLFAPRHHGRGFAPRHHGPGFGPWHHGPGFAMRHHGREFGPPHRGPWFSDRRHVLRFVERRPVPLSRQPGHRILAGRQILPFVAPRPVIVRPRHYSPSYIRVGPGPAIPLRPGFSPRHDGFGIPRRNGGLTIIVRDPTGMPPWR